MSDEINRLRVAVQKKGQLAERSLGLFEQAGIKLIKGSNDLLYRAENFPVDFLRVRDDDIPQFVGSGACQLGIVGENVLYEEAPTDVPELGIIKKLGFGKCALKIAVPSNIPYADVTSLQGCRVATTYPKLLKKYLDRQGVNAEIVFMSGAVEVAPRMQVADVICDLVSTGQTLASNGLIAKDTVLESQAVLIKNDTALPELLQELVERLLKRVEGVLATRETKYIMMNAPETALESIIDVLPGAGSPTVTPLAGKPGLIAVHAVCQESVFWETLENLKECGASAILVLPIEKMML